MPSTPPQSTALQTKCLVMTVLLTGGTDRCLNAEKEKLTKAEMLCMLGKWLKGCESVVVGRQAKKKDR